MQRKLILASFIAFCAALALGRLVFQPATRSEPGIVIEAAARSEALAVTPVKSSDAPASAAAATEQQDTQLQELIRKFGVDRSFSERDGFANNVNRLLTHRISSNYAEGTVHQYPLQFNATVSWHPAAQEIYRGSDLIAATPAASSHGKLEKRADGDRYQFQETYPNTNERFYVRPDGGIEHDIILLEPVSGIDQVSALVYSGYLSLSDDLTLWDGETKITGHYATHHGLMIRNRFNNVVFFLRPALAYDAKVTQPDGRLSARLQSQPQYSECETACEYVVDFDDTGIKLGVATPGRWLADRHRAYPVTIDPNLGQFGLADGQPPVFYVGALGSSAVIPAHTGGQRVLMEDVCPVPDPRLFYNAYGHLVTPFDFNFYGIPHPAGSLLFLHEKGFASWDFPFPRYDPFDPNDTPCFDTPNQPMPHGEVPGDMMAPYWADLKFADINSATDPSGIFFYTDGVAPSRRLIIEWHKMGFLSAGTSQEIISFNLILLECDSQIQFIIGQQGDTDLGLATVGVENVDGSIGIQYCYNGSLAGGTPQSTGGNPNNPSQPTTTGTPSPPIQPGTTITFEQSPISNIKVTNTALQGCAPLTVCFQSTVAQRVAQCLTVNNQAPLPPGFGFHWLFDDGPPSQGVGAAQGGSGSEAFTPNVCHTFSRTGTFSVQLLITDQLGNIYPFGGTLTVQVCDVPAVIVFATPQGGPAPLDVDFVARTPNNENVSVGQSTWIIDRLGPENQPGEFLTVAKINGTPPAAGTPSNYTESDAHYRFDIPSIYRATVTFAASDLTTGAQVTGVGVVFIFVTDSAAVVQDSLVITESQFVIDWTGKLDVTPKDGLPDNPDNDTIFVSGVMNNAPGFTTSDLDGHEVRVVLNGVDAIFDGVFDATGTAQQGDASTGITGQFKLTLPSGNFVMAVRKNLAFSLGLTGQVTSSVPAGQGTTTKNQNVNDAHQVDAAFDILIDPSVFPNNAVPTPNAVITYNYRSNFKPTTLPPANNNQFLPPNTPIPPPPPPLKPIKGQIGGGGTGSYKLGTSIINGKLSQFRHPKTPHSGGVPNPAAPIDFGAPVSHEQFVTGAFLTTSATVQLLGSDVDIVATGFLSRPGGDSLRPVTGSDIILSFGNYSEALNFGTTPTFKVKGNRLTFKRDKSLGTVGVTGLSWTNGVGTFAVQANQLPNEKVGIDPTQATQVLVMGLTITPESGNVFNGTTRIVLNKVSDTTFVKNNGSTKGKRLK